MWVKTEDDSVVSDTGEVIYFSAERFIRDIGEGDACFVCGAARDSKPFNDEHVMPEWLLRRYDLFDKEITLPNGAAVRYRSYTVPCCQACNSSLGRLIEEPVSAAFAGTTDELYDYLRDGNGMQLWVWLALIFLKTHLKDKQYRVHLDRRNGEEKIADDYDWSTLHHIHTVVRAYLSDSPIGDFCTGSFLFMPVANTRAETAFDFMDLHVAQALYIRLGTAGVYAVFNDAGASLNMFQQKLALMGGPISEIQAREVIVELAWLNFHILERPQFQTLFSLSAERSRIEAILPELGWEPFDLGIRGELLQHAFGNIIDPNASANLTAEEFQARMADGTLTFLFDNEGNFIR